MAKDILKDAIADAKAVREVALANAKAALEEAFTPRLQSMLSAKLSEELEEDTLEETEGMEDEGKKAKDEVDEIMEPMDETKDDKDLDETYMEDVMDEEMDEELDEEINLEEILAELELEESEMAEGKKDDDLDEAKDKDDDLDEAKDDKDLDETKKDDKDLDEAKDDDEEEEKMDEMEVNYKADTTNRTGYKAEYVHEENGNFDLDALLEEINNLDEEVDEGMFSNRSFGSTAHFDKNADPKKYDNMKYPNAFKDGKIDPQWDSFEELEGALLKYYTALSGGNEEMGAKKVNHHHSKQLPYWKEKMDGAKAMAEVQKELDETKAALKVKTTELNEVNLLNSKLLYVNRIFKANNLNEGQKLRVVETLDNASNIKEAKLIYETIKDTFTISKEKKTSPKKSIKEGLGMASKAAGTSTAPKKPVLNESNDMVTRMQKLANITIN